ncbi:MAG: hypothetical protein AAB110_01170 [Candidatus Desantisbacteria bacterium]
MNYYEDSRWLQRLQNYRRALEHLDQAMKITEEKDIENFRPEQLG